MVHNSKMKKALLGIACQITLLHLSSSFTLPSPTLTKKTITPPTPISANENSAVPSYYNALTSRKTTALYANLWSRMQIEEDPEPMWYLLNCIAGMELDLMRQCRMKCGDMDDALKFVVPVEKQTRSHGKNRILTETKTKYQGYVFGKLRLTEETYEAIQGLDLCRSWMGTINKIGNRKKMLPPSPVALNEMEIEKFGLEELEEGMEDNRMPDIDTGSDDGIILDTEETDAKDEAMKPKIDQAQLDKFKGLRPEDMVKVIGDGKFKGEDGIVKRLKLGRILVRFFTYGTVYDEWLDPKDIRKMKDDEVLRGLSGPSGPITQQDLEPDRDNGYNRKGPGGSMRSSLMGSVQGNKGDRNRRQDRIERKPDRRNFLEGGDRKQEERNWAWYQKQQQQNTDEFTVGSRSAQGEEVDGQLGRGSGRSYSREPQRVDNPRRDAGRNSRDNQSARDGNSDWSNFVSPSASPPKEGSSNNNNNDDDDAFFDSLMSELNGELQQPEEKQGPTAPSDDDFFSSMMSEFESKEESRNKNPPSSNSRRNQGEDSNNDDWSNFVSPSPSPPKERSSNDKNNDKDDFTDTDFFANLEKDLKQTNKNNGDNEDKNMDDFFSKLEAEMGGVTIGKSDKQDNEDDFFDKLEEDLTPPSSKTKDNDVDDFFADLEKDLGAPQKKKNDDDNDFFADLEKDLGPSQNKKNDDNKKNEDDWFAELDQDLPLSKGEENVDDFFAKLEQELSSKKENDGVKVQKPLQEKEDDFFSELEKDLETGLPEEKTSDEVKTVDGASKKVKTSSRSTSTKAPSTKDSNNSIGAVDQGSLGKKTMPILKDMLRERGLKVSGRKAELVERLLQSS